MQSKVTNCKSFNIFLSVYVCDKGKCESGGLTEKGLSCHDLLKRFSEFLEK